MIKIRTVEEIVLKRLHKYLKVFEKKLERMLMRKPWDHTIDLSNRFVSKKGKICYNPKLSSGCNLGKDLRKNEGDDQLIKDKDTGLYLLLYIPIDHEKYGRYS